MIILFINCKLFPFIQWIIQGLKVYETRNRNTLKTLVGKTVYLAETGKGKKPIIRCSCMIDSYITIQDKKTFNRYRKQTMIAPGTFYDYNGKTKYLYRLVNVQACIPFPLPDNVIRHGRIYCETI